MESATVRPAATHEARTMRPKARSSVPPEGEVLFGVSDEGATDTSRRQQVTLERLCSDFDREMTPELRLRVVLEVLRALNPVHTNLLRPPEQRCHGTLNPGCILINPEGTVSLFWQPMAKPTARQRPYLAPEVRRGSDPDQQADIYSVGVMLYEAVTACRLGTAAPEPSKPTIAPWAEPLLDIAIEAMYIAPARRWASALGFSGGILALAKSHVAKRADLCALVRRALETECVTSGADSVDEPGESGISAVYVSRSGASPALSGEVLATALGPESISAGPVSRTEPKSGMWFSARRTPAIAWFGVSAAAVLLASLTGFWFGRTSPEAQLEPVKMMGEPQNGAALARPALGSRGSSSPAVGGPALEARAKQTSQAEAAMNSPELGVPAGSADSPPQPSAAARAVPAAPPPAAKPKLGRKQHIPAELKTYDPEGI